MKKLKINGHDGKPYTFSALNRKLSKHFRKIVADLSKKYGVLEYDELSRKNFKSEEDIERMKQIDSNATEYEEKLDSVLVEICVISLSIEHSEFKISSDDDNKQLMLDKFDEVFGNSEMMFGSSFALSGQYKGMDEEIKYSDIVDLT